MMNKRIVRRSAPSLEGLADSGLPPLLQRIYASRGIRHAGQLDRSLKALHPYHDLCDIDRAAREIGDAVVKGERILVVGDFDCDGATSCALALLALRAMGAAWVDFLVPNRFAFGYGLSPEIVAVAAEHRPDLLITVDNGISSIEGVQAARRRGMRVVVTDHHLPGAELPEAEAVVNPSRSDCAFAAKHTCGVGVIFYVMSAVRRYLENQGWFGRQGIAMPRMVDYLDLVALGTVADVVPLDQNNRALVAQGLARIRAGKARPGLLALLEVAGRSRSRLMAADLGFALAPRLNAAGRLEDISIGIRCLLTDDAQEARQLAQELNELNQQRRQIEQGMQQQALDILETMTLSTDALPFGVCLFDESWHEGVIGILASRIKERLHRPVIAFAGTDSEAIKGSARSIPGFHVRDALDAIATRHPGLLSKFGGHAMAAGLTLEKGQLPAFKEAFDAEVRRQLCADDFQPELASDGELGPAEMTLEMADQLQQAGPWGQLFPEPRFDGCFRLIQQRLVGERHLKLVVQPEKGADCFDAIAFNVDLSLWPNQATRAEIAYRLDINEFRGNTRLQLIVDHLEPRE